jgi:hypothetical protein
MLEDDLMNCSCFYCTDNCNNVFYYKMQKQKINMGISFSLMKIIGILNKLRREVIACHSRLFVMIL